MAMTCFTAWDCWWLAPIAFALDVWLKDPPLPFPHPVRLIGRGLDALEPFARRMDSLGFGRAAGAVCALGCAAAAGATILALLQFPLLNYLVAVYFAYAGLAQGSLLEAGRSCAKVLGEGSVEDGRKALSGLVSRDVSSLDPPMLRKTLADTLSENYTDAFLAPYFWLLLAGPAGLWFYKAISTADSMWGYRTPDWQAIGWAGARADDALAFIPARLGVLVFQLTDSLARKLRIPHPWRGTWPGTATVAAQAAGMPSPNSGWPMAACAWLCDAPMGGPSVYFGSTVNKPWLGPPGTHGRWDGPRLLALLALLCHAGECGAAVTWLGCMILRTVAG